MAIIIPPCVMILITLYHLPAESISNLWPLFLPGVYLLVKGTSRTPNSATLSSRRIAFSISWLTFYVACYAAATFVLLIFPWLHYLYDQWRANNLLEVALLLNFPVLGAAAVLGTFRLLRSHQLDQIESEILKEVNSELALIDDLTAAFPHIAEIIQTRLDLELFFIVRPEPKYYTLMATRRVGNGDEPFPECKLQVVGAAPLSDPEAASVSEQTYSINWGYSAEVIQSREPLLVNNIRKRKGGVQHEGLSLKNLASELVVPIFDLDRPDLLLALLLADSRHTNAFDRHDKETLEKVASYIAAFARRTPLAYHEQRQALDNISGPHSFETTIDKAIEEASKLFKTPYCVFFPLGLGTAALLPVRAKYLIENTFTQPKFLKTEAVSIADGPILDAVKVWEPHFYDPKDACELPENWQRWHEGEGITASAFIPVGMRNRRLGVLYIGFAHLEWGFSSSLRIFLSNFAQAIMPQLGAARYIEQIYQGFLAQTIHLHEHLNFEHLARGTLEDRIAQIEQAIKPETTSRRSNAEGELLDLLHRVSRVLLRVEAEDRAMLPDFADQAAPQSLEEALGEFWASLRTQWPQLDRLEGYIDERVERESPDLKLILYRIVTQAIFNAINHGSASSVWYRLVRLQHELIIDIADPGKGFNTAMLVNRGKGTGGILYLDELLQKHMGSKSICWGWTQPKVGTYLGIRIPLLFDPDAPSEVVRRSRLDDIQNGPPWLQADEWLER
ncbi:MAG: GAF domain-containing protein, partial [Chloroflexia bacterium]